MSISGSGFSPDRPYAGLGPDDGPDPIETDAHRPILMYRVECSCGGWSGTVLATEFAALSQHARHVRHDH